MGRVIRLANSVSSIAAKVMVPIISGTLLISGGCLAFKKLRFKHSPASQVKTTEQIITPDGLVSKNFKYISNLHSKNNITEDKFIGKNNYPL